MTEPASRLPSIAFFCPTYKDEDNIIQVVEKAVTLMPTYADKYEVVIIEDGSPDKTCQVVDELSSKHDHVRVIHHPNNLGYGAAIKSGFINSRNYEFICYTDGDNQYDVADIGRMIPLLKDNDMVVSFRENKSYGHYRMFMSQIYNWLIHVLFKIPDHDVGSPTKIFHRSVAESIRPDSNSPFANAEIIIKARSRGLRVKNVCIKSYPRVFGKSSVASWRNILLTIKDIFILKYRLLRMKPRPG